MNRHAILHIPMSEHAHALDDGRIVFRLRAARDDLAACTLLYGDRSCPCTPVDMAQWPMTVVARDALFDWYEAVLETTLTRVCYAFSLADNQGGRAVYYGGAFSDALPPDRSAYFQLPFNHRADRADAPAWMRDAVVYNVFPDSFATGRRRVSGAPSKVTEGGEAHFGKNGGTLRGVTENLDYLRDLGVSCLYLNPVFSAGEYHKYDVIDYYHIDPAFGTDEDFRALVKAAHALGIRVVIDGVFNHCGWRFFAFRDAAEKGRASRYWHWFYRLEEPVVIPPDGQKPPYECFGYERRMPKLATDEPEVRDYFCAVGRHWVREYGIDGWRLDVANEVDDGFWRAFRRAVKAENPDCALIGEIWETASHWLDGSMFDSAMNYAFRRHLAAFLMTGDGAALEAGVTDMLTRYRRPMAYAQLNLLDSHDVSRFLSLLGGDEGLMRLAVLFQMTFVGMPCVFYGDELAATGVEEAEYRLPMPWDGEGCGLHDFYRRAIALRNAEPCLRRGDYRTLRAEAGDGLYQYRRFLDGEQITVTLNHSARPRRVEADGRALWQSGWECGILAPRGFLVCKREG